MIYKIFEYHEQGVDAAFDVSITQPDSGEALTFSYATRAVAEAFIADIKRVIHTHERAQFRMVTQAGATT